MTNPLRSLLPLLALLAALGAARADMIIFKDGLALQGKVVRERKTVVDPATGQAFEVNEGFFMVYDGARTVLFSTAHLDRAIDDKEFAPEKGELRSGLKHVTFPGSRPLLPIIEVTDFGTFDKDWNRTLSYITIGDRPFSVKQNLTQLTPYFARLDSALNLKSNIQYLGTTCYLTSELGPARVRGLLADHKDIKDDPEKPDQERLNRRLKGVQFLAQCGWLDHAAVDLDKVEKDFPALKEDIATARTNLQKMRNLQTAHHLKRAFRAGNFRRFEQLLDSFAEDGVPQQTLADVRQMKDDFQTAHANVKLANRYLSELPREVPQQLRDLFTEAAEAIRAELTHDNVSRLESFLGQARQAERQKAEGRNPTLAPVNLVALALSGWVLGNVSAETMPNAALKLWQTRQMVLKYQATHDGPARRDVLDKYVNDKSGTVALDELPSSLLTCPRRNQKRSSKAPSRTSRPA